mmetsp:Transcript_43736/g.50296  ORF Transcript_43736/g.50296 Transcript_43736/m.50296 type:complete len:208 (+) Transcript_43736:216-839(+)
MEEDDRKFCYIFYAVPLIHTLSILIVNTPCDEMRLQGHVLLDFKLLLFIILMFSGDYDEVFQSTKGKIIATIYFLVLIPQTYWVIAAFQWLDQDTCEKYQLDVTFVLIFLGFDTLFAFTQIAIKLSAFFVEVGKKLGRIYRARQLELPLLGYEVCSICMEGMNPSMRVVQLSCKHRYHHHCLDKWLQTQTNCPYCRIFVDRAVLDMY